MKMALNGALTIGTLDGANIEIRQAVGEDNFFLFGLNAEEVAAVRTQGYAPDAYYQKDEELRQALDMIASGYFSEPGLFSSIVRDLREKDFYMLLADYRPYIQAQQDAEQLFADPDQWAKRSILNTARMGIFSSDRSILEYAGNIWHVQPLAFSAMTNEVLP
jgi:glycogen phosphorylase